LILFLLFVEHIIKPLPILYHYKDILDFLSENNITHYEVGAKVRQTIKELGGTMPEDLPTPEKSIKQIEREQENKKLADEN